MDLKRKTNNDYIKNGKLIFEEHCPASKGRPLFFPDVAVARLPGNQSSTGREIRALHIEAELDKCNSHVYSALKCLNNQPIIVLHKFLYNHNQFHMWDPQYDPEACAKEPHIPNCSLEYRSAVAGSHDFLLFGPGYVVLIDVYAPVTEQQIENWRENSPEITSHRVLERIEERCRSQLNSKLSSQRASLELFDRIAERTAQLSSDIESEALTDIKIFRYVAFPREKTEIGGILRLQDMTETGEKVGVITETCLADLQLWWAENIIASNPDQFNTTRGNFKIMQHALFAIWCDLDGNGGEKAEIELDRETFYGDPNKIHAALNEIPTHVTLHSILQASKGSSLGYSEVEKIKSEVGKSGASHCSESDQLDLESICKNIRFQGSQVFSHVEIFNNFRSLKANEELKDKKTYFNRGKALFETFCSNTDNFARMFPTCPNHKYIDLHRSAEESEKTAADDIKKQQDYEAEVKVYRALESLECEDIIVIHSLKYTHYQYRMWDPDHNPKECSKKKRQPNCKNGLYSDEGENDFVVIGPNYIVLIEVKNAEQQASRDSLAGFAKSAAEQLDKLMLLIKGIAQESVQIEASGERADLGTDLRQIGPESDTSSPENKPIHFKVFRFVAFPGCKAVIPDDDVNYVKDQQDMKLKYIFSNDLGELAVWWSKNVTEKIESCSVDDVYGDLEKVKTVLWTIWATEGKRFDSSSIGLKRDLIDTDRRLRESEITMVSKNSRRNLPSNVVRTENLTSANVNGINIFHDILGISHITKNQHEAFEKKSQCLVITGCAGSGKSLILLARFLRQALTNKKPKMALLVFNQLKLVEYRNFFKKCNVSIMDVADDEFDANLWQSTVGIIHCSTQSSNRKLVSVLEELKKNDVITYLDDAHASSVDLSWAQCECVAVDFNQCHLTRDQIRLSHSSNRADSLVDFDDLVSLTHNYRSTWNIVANLINLSQVIRAREVEQKNFAEYPAELSHDPSHGHLIYGPQTDIDVISHREGLSESKQWQEIFGAYIKRIPLFLQGGEFTKKVFIIDPKGDSFFRQLARQVNDYPRDRLLCVNVNSREQSIYSAEFAICFVFVVFSNMDTKMLRTLYNVISRARSYCHIMVITNEETSKEELKNFLDIFTEAKINHVTSPPLNLASDEDESGTKNSMLDIELD